MKSFNLGNTNIIIKDSFRGSYYHPDCKSCYMYPCLHGIYCPIIASDGTMQVSNCINKNFQRRVLDKSDEEVQSAFDEVMKVINESNFEKLDESQVMADKGIQKIDLMEKIKS